MSKEYDNPEIQKALLEVLISSPETFSICEPIFEPRYFNPGLNKAAAFIKEYYNEYSKLPEPFQIRSSTKQKLEKVAMAEDIERWAKKSFEGFARHRAIILAITDSMEEMNKGNYDSVKTRIDKAYEIALAKDTGYNYFDDIRSRIERAQNAPPTMSTGWKSVDEKLFGGIARREFILFAGNSGVGKSFTLANLALNFIKQGKNALFLSLELSSDRVSQRFDQMFTGINGAEWDYHTETIINIIESKKSELGNLHIAKLPAGTKAREMRAFLKDFYLKNGYYPDLFVVDYLDEMNANDHVSADNISEKDKRCASELRQIGDDLDIAVASASQLNRPAIEAPELNQSHIAGGMGKIRIADVAIALRMDESQKHRGIMEFVFIKTRNSDSVFDKLMMEWDRKYVTIRDPKRKQEENKPALKFKKKENNIGNSKDQSTNELFDHVNKYVN